MTGKDGDPLVTQKRAAELMGKSLAAVNELVRRGRLRSEVIYGKRLVHLTDVENFVPEKPARKKSDGKQTSKRKITKTASKKKGAKK